jgi:hypothetical protein
MRWTTRRHCHVDRTCVWLVTRFVDPDAEFVFHVVVVGGGIVGLTTALLLAQQGRDGGGRDARVMHSDSGGHRRTHPTTLRAISTRTATTSRHARPVLRWRSDAALRPSMTPRAAASYGTVRTWCDPTSRRPFAVPGALAGGGPGTRRVYATPSVGKA